MIILSHKNTVFSSKFQKEFRKLPESTQKQVKKNFSSLFAEEKTGNIKALKNYKYAQFRLRIGSYRLLFSKSEQGKYVFLRIKHRKNLY